MLRSLKYAATDSSFLIYDSEKGKDKTSAYIGTNTGQIIVSTRLMFSHFPTILKQSQDHLCSFRQNIIVNRCGIRLWKSCHTLTMHYGRLDDDQRIFLPINHFRFYLRKFALETSNFLL